MSVTAFTVHRDTGEAGVARWADSEQVAGCSAAADSLDDLCRLIDEAVTLYVGPCSAFFLESVATIPPAAAVPAESVP
jgi:hypothetical protein